MSHMNNAIFEIVKREFTCQEKNDSILCPTDDLQEKTGKSIFYNIYSTCQLMNSLRKIYQLTGSRAFSDVNYFGERMSKRGAFNILLISSFKLVCS